MKPFNLEEALKGAPVRLRDGRCAWVYGNASVVPDWERYIDGPPLKGMQREDDNVIYDNFGWELDGRFDPEEDNHPLDIIEMWEEPKLSQEQILEKAYNEGLKVTFDTASHDDGYDVVGKLRSGSYLLQHGIVLIKSTNLTGIELYQEKPSTSTVTVTLHKPFKPESYSKYYRISANGYGGLFVKECLYPLDYTEKHICFRTREDAQAWLDAMKEAVDERMD